MKITDAENDLPQAAARAFARRFAAASIPGAFKTGARE
jgi:hypothetical protein